MKGYAKNDHVDEPHQHQHLCTDCGVNPPLGALKRCTACIKAEADRGRAARNEATERVKVRKDAELVARGRVKACRCCKTTKPITAFQVWRAAKDGRRRDCKACVTSGANKRRRPRTVPEKAREKLQAAAPHRREANRRAVREWTARNPEAVAAKKKMRAALKSGVIARPSRCQVRGCKCREKPVGHHIDYRYPLVVAWVCGSHHRQLHNGDHLDLISGLPPELVSIPATLEGASA